MVTRKFMQTLDDKLYKELDRIALARGITVQQLLRAVIVPEWFAERSIDKQAGSRRRVGQRRLERSKRLAPGIRTPA